MREIGFEVLEGLKYGHRVRYSGGLAALYLFDWPVLQWRRFEETDE
jgi:hypothetical protein